MANLIETSLGNIITITIQSHLVSMIIRAWFSRTSNLTFERACNFLVRPTLERFRIPRRQLVLADHLLKKPFIIQRKSLQDRLIALKESRDRMLVYVLFSLILYMHTVHYTL